MEGLIKLMEVALFNTERTAELLIEEEANDSLGMTPSSRRRRWAFSPQ